jgi:hypothetical protein
MEALELSTEQLEKMLAERKQAEKEKKAKDKASYEKNRDALVESLYAEAEEIALTLSRFKDKCHIVLDQQAEKLKTYGGIRSSSKGGFSLPHSAGQLAVTRRRDTDAVWDERATKAVELIKDFLGDTVKKRDADLHDILMGFIERNDKGDLEYAKVMELFQHQDKFSDERWVNGLQLIKESYRQVFKAYTYEFKRKNRAGKWQNLTLNFSTL